MVKGYRRSLGLVGKFEGGVVFTNSESSYRRVHTVLLVIGCVM